MIVGLGLLAALVELMVTLTRMDALSPTMMAAKMVALGVTLVWVVVRLVVGGALAILFLRLVLTEVRGGMAGGVSETTARMLVVLWTILMLGGLFLAGGRHLSLVA